MQLASKIIVNTGKFMVREYGDEYGYSITYKILNHEIFVTGPDAVTVRHTWSKITEKFPNLSTDQVLKRVWDRYESMSTPIIFESDREIPE